MTRKEKVTIKTFHFCQEIIDAMKGAKTFEDAMDKADIFINRQIRVHPQEKSFIINCGNIAKKLVKQMGEQYETL